MKMEFNVQQRIILLSLIPRDKTKGDLRTIRSVKKFRDEIVLSKEEINVLSFKTEGNGNFSWNSKKDVPIEAEVDNYVYDFIVQKLNDLIVNKEVQEYHLEFFDRFEVDQRDENNILEKFNKPVNTVQLLEEDM